MQKILLSFALLPILLAGCTSSNSSGPNLEAHLLNPLYAERYYDNLVDRIVELEIQKDPILENERKKKIADETRRKALAGAQEAQKKQREGPRGFFIGVQEYAQGETLYLGDTLYLSTTFETDPGPSLHLYLSTIVDPRDTEFPDETTFDLGRLESPYGVQQYAVPEVEDPLLYRTAVLWDTKLERLYGFAQLSM